MALLQIESSQIMLQGDINAINSMHTVTKGKRKELTLIEFLIRLVGKYFYPYLAENKAES